MSKKSENCRHYDNYQRKRKKTSNVFLKLISNTCNQCYRIYWCLCFISSSLFSFLKFWFLWRSFSTTCRMFWRCLSLCVGWTKSVASFTPHLAASFTMLIAFTFSALIWYASLVSHSATRRWWKLLLIWILNIVNYKSMSTRWHSPVERFIDDGIFIELELACPILNQSNALATAAAWTAALQQGITQNLLLN